MKRREKRERDAAELKRVLDILLERHGGRERLLLEEATFWRFVDDVVSIARGAQLLSSAE